MTTSRRPAATVNLLAAITLGLAVLALVTPFAGAEHPPARVGWLLAFAAAIEMLHALRRSAVNARRAATSGAVISLVIALFLINAPFVAGEALRCSIAGWFGVDAVRTRSGVSARRIGARAGSTASPRSAMRPSRCCSCSRATGCWRGSCRSPARSGFSASPGTSEVAPVYDHERSRRHRRERARPRGRAGGGRHGHQVDDGEEARAPIDRAWTISFIVTLFAIHIGRMRVDLTFLGLISPAVAVLGDIVIAVIFTLLVINPIYLLWRGPTRWIERAHVALAPRAHPRPAGPPARAGHGGLAALEDAPRDPHAGRRAIRCRRPCCRHSRPACRSPRFLRRPCRCGA